MARLERAATKGGRLWRDSPHDSPDSDSVYNLVNKMSDVPTFMEVLQGYLPAHVSAPALRVLELGGGQGCSACLLKRLCPQASVTLTDISSYAVQSAHQWERVFDVKLDAANACTSYETREPPDSVDVVFCFAAAHHFRAHHRTLAEIRRILRPGGVALYLFEPVCPRVLYQLAYRRINRGRPEIEEDVRVWRERAGDRQRMRPAGPRRLLSVDGTAPAVGGDLLLGPEPASVSLPSTALLGQPGVHQACSDLSAHRVRTATCRGLHG